MTLKIAAQLSLSMEFVTKTAAIVAQRRKGKTYTAAVLAEEMVRNQVPFVALDPTGAWWGLRAAADGKREGLPVVILGGQHGDLPLERTAGKFVAELVVDEPGYYVIDFSLFESGAAEQQFATDFAERLYRRKAKENSDFAMHLFVDEANRFVPQRTMPGEQRMLGAFEALVLRGGLRGIGTTLITQRPAVVNKNVLEQIDMLIALRIVGPNDRDAVKRYVESYSSGDQTKTFMASLSSLGIGEAWVWEPGGDPPIYEKVQIRERRTFNSSATPKAGEVRVEPRVLADVDKQAIEARMKEAIDRAKADDPKELQKRIRELEAEVRDVESERDTIAVSLARETVTEVVVPKTVLEMPQYMETLVQDLQIVADQWTAKFKELQERLDGELAEAEAAWTAVPGVRRGGGRTDPVENGRRSDRPAQRLDPPTERTVGGAPVSGAKEDLSKQARGMLEELARRHPMRLTASQLSTMSGYSKKSSSWRPSVNALVDGGYVFMAGNVMTISPLGLEIAGVRGEQPKSAQEMVAMWQRRLPAQAGYMLECLSRHQTPLPEEKLSEKTGYSLTSSSWNGSLKVLETNGLIERESGYVKAVDELQV